MGETELQDQTTRLRGPKLFITLISISSTLFLAFLDQTSVSTALPSISNDLHTGTSISWVGTSFLIANTVFQLLYGRISDIFGRKYVLLASIFLLALGDLLCGFARSNIELFIFRSISGIGSGGILCMGMVVVSDIMSLRDRAKYFGFLSAAATLGNGAGPFVGGVFSEKVTWRWTFWIVPPLCILGFTIALLIIPQKPVEGKFLEKAKLIDWLGSFLSLVSLLLLLVAISGGGLSWPWNSSIVISMSIISGLALIGFFIVEAKHAKLPMVPLRLFKNPSLIALFLMSFIVGFSFYIDIYYLPIYLQSIRGWTPISAGAIMLPNVATSSIFSIFSGSVD